ncbi:MAG: ABC transporter ATP-binding protein [Candidatus Omnitrophota bacterium]
MRNIIHLQDVRKAYGRKVILDRVSLDVPEGMVIGLLGKNGAGKTTLLKCLLGLFKVDAGKSLVFGDDSWHLSAGVKASIGYVPQGYRPYPWLQAGWLIEYTASFYPQWNSALTAKLVKDWGLDLGARVDTFSEGELQKLLIILALGHEPKLLVFDEPVASLDPVARREFLKMILDVVSERPCTILFSTHITSDLERVADTVAVLRAGRLDLCGGIDVLKESVKRIRFHCPAGVLPVLGDEGVINSYVSGQQAILTVRDYSDARRVSLEKISGARVEVEDLNLEEIFLEMNR